MQDCFKPQSYLTFEVDGILPEIISLLSIGVLLVSVLMFWEYKWVAKIINLISGRWFYRINEDYKPRTAGTIKEMRMVQAKVERLKNKPSQSKI